MQELITSIASKVGISEELAQKAVSTVLSLVQSGGDDGLVSQLFDKMPGAADLASAGSESSGGGGLMGMVGGMLGGSAGDMMSAVSSLKSEGLDMDQIKQVGEGVFEYAKEKGGDDLVSKVTDSIPGLDKFL